MKLTLEDILKGVINEAVSSDEVLDAIHNRRYVKIRYNDGKEGNPNGRRTIQPVAVGTTKKGHPVVRAFQVGGNSRRGAPKWKFFRLDRIESWKPYKKTFNSPPDDSYGPYNRVGDKSMGTFIDNAKFVDPNSPLARVKSTWDDIKNGPKISTKNTQGPVHVAQQRKKNVYTSQPNSEKYRNAAKNIDNTEKKDQSFWDLYDLAAKEAEQQNNTVNTQGYQSGPIHNNSYDEDYYDIEDVNFDENNFITNKNKR